MPILTPEQGELLIAVFTIGFGIVVEKWYVSRSSIYANVSTWFVMLFTISINPADFGLLGLWLLLGIALTKVEGLGGIKQLFGSKVFGSTALILGLYKFGYLQGNTFFIWVIFGCLLVGVFACGRMYADNDDRDQYEEYWW